MRAIFSPQQLVSCSMKGAFTCRHGAPRPGLPHEDTAIIIEQVSQKYGTSIPEVEKKFRSALHRLSGAYKGTQTVFKC
ncbi:hypothetical protein DPMN_119414 [Dreissena polymorpha]|uniref:Uncharacterized protein n=2 Tax=Dreissena polymorpha TaxID=45954 RepID=A0A9D4GLS7_DREPO|nr:hypothetical protein DPMN_119414 [Dreissena polymorpha]